MSVSGRGPNEQGETRYGSRSCRGQAGFDLRVNHGHWRIRYGRHQLNGYVGSRTKTAIRVGGPAVVMAVRHGKRSGKNQQRNAKQAEKQPPSYTTRILPLNADHRASILADSRKR
jgi:hypothetical protein